MPTPSPVNRIAKHAPKPVTARTPRAAGPIGYAAPAMRSRWMWGAGLVAALAVLAVWSVPRLRPWLRERSIRSAPARPDVLLVTLDTTRADRLGCYEGGPETTPALDALAEGGVLFRRAYTHVPTTLASHASLFTGVTPARHGVHENGTFVLDAALPTLAESLAAAGYRTGAFVSAAVLDRRFGLARGFQDYGDDLGSAAGGGVLAEVRAEHTVTRALAFLARPPDQPRFLWVHLYDAHHPYTPPEPFASRFPGRPYDGEIAYMDSQVARLLEAVKAGGRPTLVAVVADHGESLGEHQEPTHAFFVYGATQHVPLLLSFPGVLPAGRQVAPLVRTVDLLPTMLELAAVPVPAGIDGRSLVPLVTGRSDRETGPAYQEAYGPRLHWGAQEVLGMRTGRWLYVRAPRPELYDVEEDPAETVNLAAERPEERERMEALLREWVPKGDPLARRVPLDPETARKLAALGYVGSTMGEPAKGQPLADPKDVAPLLAEIASAEELRTRKETAKALDAYRALVARLPASVSLRGRVAETLLELERFDEAFEAYRALGQEHPQDEAQVVGMARARVKQGRSEDALAVVRGGLVRLPGSAALHQNAGTLLATLKRNREAEVAYREAARLDPRDPSPRLALALLYDLDGRSADAARQFLDAIEASPASPLARQAARRLATLAEGLARERKLEQAREAYAGVLRTDEAEAPVHLNAALVSFQLGRTEEATQILARGAQRFPQSVDLLYRLGRLQAERKDARAAEGAYLQALGVDAGRNDIRLALARALEAQGRLPEAMVVYERLAAAQPPVRESGPAAAALQRLRVRGGP
jgi:arylsulfatase A-like enzyme/tetratricopeptide (TPR) repeat protein